eukprot:m.23209 g.23209  ORF g.23209 m.23209 type:complete len:124 (-) comp14120_c0_seq1:272-643(-)
MMCGGYTSWSAPASDAPGLRKMQSMLNKRGLKDACEKYSKRTFTHWEAVAAPGYRTRSQVVAGKNYQWEVQVKIGEDAAKCKNEIASVQLHVSEPLMGYSRHPVVTAMGCTGIKDTTSMWQPK